MAGALIGLQALLGLSGIFLVFDGPIALSLLALATGVLLIVIALSIRASEAALAWQAGRVAAAMLLLPIGLMLVQCLPNPLGANPIWSTAASALNERLIGSVTIDLGATLTALGRMLVLAALGAATLAITINRRRVEGLLHLLIAVTAILPLAMMAALALMPSFAAELSDLHQDLHAPLTAIASLGILVGTTAMIRRFEQFEVSRGHGAPGPLRRHSRAAADIVALAICVAAVIAVGSRMAWLAVFCSWFAVFSVPVIRRFLTRTSSMRSVMASVVVLVVLLLAIPMLQGAGEPVLRIAARADAAQLGLAQRMLGDSHWLGNGAGTYAAVAPVYRTLADATVVLMPPTTAAALALDFGRPALALFVILGGALAMVLFDRALRRGRDSYYPALGGGALILSVFTLFVDFSLASTTVAVLLVIVVGLALGQSMSTKQPQE